MLFNLINLIYLFILFIILLLQYYYNSNNILINKISYSNINKMIQLIELQNQTIITLSDSLSYNNKEDNIQIKGERYNQIESNINNLILKLKQKENEINKLYNIIKDKDNELKNIKENYKVDIKVNSKDISKEIIIKSSSNSYSLTTSNTKFQNECELRYGLSLIDEWKSSKEVWCSNSQQSKLQSSLICYPYKQKHKQSYDMFCEANNFIIDFSKVKGQHSKTKMRGDSYLNFESNSLLSSCKKTNLYKEQYFMPHHSLQVIILY